MLLKCFLALKGEYRPEECLFTVKVPSLGKVLMRFRPRDTDQLQRRLVTKRAGSQRRTDPTVSPTGRDRAPLPYILPKISICEREIQSANNTHTYVHTHTYSLNIQNMISIYIQKITYFLGEMTNCEITAAK